MKAPVLFMMAILALAPAQAQQRTYDHPRVTTYPVDNCLYFGKVCGKPAADAFCHRKGYREAEHYRVESARPTWVLGEDRVCDEDYCKGLTGVVCTGVAREPELTTEPATDRFGSDYHDFELRAARPEFCRRACALDPMCRSYTYAKPGTTGRGNTPWCYLKDSVPRATRDDCCISGTKK